MCPIYAFVTFPFLNALTRRRQAASIWKQIDILSFFRKVTNLVKENGYSVKSYLFLLWMRDWPKFWNHHPLRPEWAHVRQGKWSARAHRLHGARFNSFFRSFFRNFNLSSFWQTFVRFFCTGVQNLNPHPPKILQ